MDATCSRRTRHESQGTAWILQPGIAHSGVRGLVSKIILNREKAIITGQMPPAPKPSRLATSTPRFSRLYRNGAPERIEMRTAG